MTTSRHKPTYTPEDPFFNARESATYRAQGLSTFWRDVKAGVVPPPAYIGPRSPRWRKSWLDVSIDSAPRTSPRVA